VVGARSWVDLIDGLGDDAVLGSEVGWVGRGGMDLSGI
jgi:hypothetical protein